MTDDEPYNLTPEQKKAFSALERAFKRCVKENVYVWDNYGSISAVNGDAVRCIVPGDGGEDIDDQVSWFTSKSYHGSNADDPLFVERS